MNHRMILHMTGQIVRLEAALLLLPIIVALCYGESCLWALLITAAFALLLGTGMVLLSRPRSTAIYAKDGFVIVALAWLFLSLIGAIPFTLSGEIPFYVDAVFETVSGFTTTGSSILTDVEAMSHGLLFWRSFTHFIGGMGVLVLIVAILPTSSGRTMHILRAEMPGPVVGKLVPKARDTAKILYIMYIALTAAEFILLLCGGMPVFDSAVHALGTAGTGGFGIRADSVGSYSPYLQWVITIFMAMFGVNFNLYFLILSRQFRSALRSRELWCYVAILLGATLIITLNILPQCESVGESLRLAAFQVSSISTTTGYSTYNFDLWPELSKGILLALMFIGGCAGSTAGGFKLSRLMMLFKITGRELRHMLHPHSVGVVKFEGKRVDDQTLSSVNVYLVLYCGVMAVLCLLICWEPCGMVTNFTAVVACFNNIGPGFAKVGAAGSFAFYSPFSKLVLTLAMLLGRLEIYPILFALSPSTWKRR